MLIQQRQSKITSDTLLIKLEPWQNTSPLLAYTQMHLWGAKQPHYQMAIKDLL